MSGFQYIGTGPQGPTGAAGTNGTNGATGPTGPTGPQGVAGIGTSYAWSTGKGGSASLTNPGADFTTPFWNVVNTWTSCGSTLTVPVVNGIVSVVCSLQGTQSGTFAPNVVQGYSALLTPASGSPIRGATMGANSLAGGRGIVSILRTGIPAGNCVVDIQYFWASGGVSPVVTCQPTSSTTTAHYFEFEVNYS